MIALVVTAIIATMSVMGYTAVRSNVSARSVVPLLVSAQLELRRALTDGVFPPQPTVVMAPLPGVVYLPEGPAGDDQVSVWRANPDTVLLAAPSGDACVVLVDRIGQATGWAKDPQGAGRCDAALAWSVLENIEPGTESQPAEVSLP